MSQSAGTGGGISSKGTREFDRSTATAGGVVAELMAESLESGLVALCLEAATKSKESVEGWRRQVRTLERLPSPLAEALLRHLLRRRLLYPSLLEIFRLTVEEVDLSGENLVDAEWMAYVGAFLFLRSLNLEGCNRINNAALWSITGMTSLKELNLSRCSKVSDGGIRHVISISALQKLWVAETGLTANGVKLISSLTRLRVLDLGGLPVTDQSLASLQLLKELQYLDLWGSKVSNEGITLLKEFCSLNFLNLAWTSVTKLPYFPSLTTLNMSNCTIDSIFEGSPREEAPFAKLIVSGATFSDVPEAFCNVPTRFLSLLDVSRSSLENFKFLANMRSLQHLNLSFSMIGDDSAELVASVGANLRDLDLRNTRVTSAGLEILAGHVPNLETISLADTFIDDFAIRYLGLMPSLKVIDLSNTHIKGLICGVGNESNDASLSALQSLSSLKILNLEGTHVNDSALSPLQHLQELRQLSLRSHSLTDFSLHQLSSVQKLTNLGFRDAVLTNGGLSSFHPPAWLEVLDLRGCWLLTEDAITMFCEKYPQIEVRHEFAQKLPSIPERKYGSVRRVKSTSTDQRIKYTVEELLAMNPSSLAEPCTSRPSE